MKIINTTHNTVVADNGRMADSAVSRMVGLLNRSSFLDGEGLVITKCNSIHMFFMKFAIDCIFVDKNNQVVGLVENIKPFRLSRIFFNASYVIEVPVGVIKQSETQVGDQIDLQ